MLMSLSRWYKRLRRSLGFGVHSPLAYRMVTEVLNPPRVYGYYIYDRIPSMRKTHPTLLSNHDLQLIYRLVHELQPSSVSIYSESSAILEILIKTAVPSAQIKPSGGEMLICEAMCHPEEETPSDGFKAAFFSDSSNPAVERMWQRLGDCHFYRNPERAVLLKENGVPRQRFDIRF